MTDELLSREVLESKLPFPLLYPFMDSCNKRAGLKTIHCKGERVSSKSAEASSALYVSWSLSGRSPICRFYDLVTQKASAFSLYSTPVKHIFIKCTSLVKSPNYKIAKSFTSQTAKPSLSYKKYDDRHLLLFS